MATKRGHGEGSIYKRKDGRWAATITLEAKGTRRQRRSFYGRTRAEVAKKLREGLKKQDENLPIPSEVETVSSFLDGWIKGLNDGAVLRPRTLESYSLIVRKHLLPELGRLRLARLSPSDVQSYLASKRARGLSARTVQYHHAVLRRALGQAERWGKVARNVAKLVSPPKVERSELRPLSPEEARTLLGAIGEDRLVALYAVAIGLGLRQGELLGLQWEDLNLDSGTLTVRHTLQRYDREYHLDPPKTDRSRRTIGVPHGLVMLLHAHKNQQRAERLKAGGAWQGDMWGLVFCTPLGRPLSGNNLTHEFQAILSRAELPRQRFHDLRHAAATFMLAQGVDLRVVMEVLGHSQIHVTANTYAHVRIEATRVAAERVDALLAR